MCNSAAVQCITQHPLLRDICLRRELLVVYAPQFCRYDQHFRRLNPQDHRCLRFTAYSSFTRWVWGYLGPRNRRQVPGCVVRAIRREFPSTSYQGYQRYDHRSKGVLTRETSWCILMAGTGDM
ncbi:uncharacterized protein LOC135370877 [Ornithodoros turicata]